MYFAILKSQVMTDFTALLDIEFEKSKKPQIAIEQKAYMRNQFDFYGLKARERREIQKPFLIKKHLPTKDKLDKIVKTLWEKPQRENQLFAQELVFKYIIHFERKDMGLLEFMVTNKSWWDTVDYIACNLMGAYFKKFPEERLFYVDKWLKSKNMWLQRSALLFQLKYKMDLDTHILSLCIGSLQGSKEFFINKAIGWVLREYSRSNPKWVLEFVSKTTLHSLSKREALRRIQ